MLAGSILQMLLYFYFLACRVDWDYQAERIYLKMRVTREPLIQQETTQLTTYGSHSYDTPDKIPGRYPIFPRAIPAEVKEDDDPFSEDDSFTYSKKYNKQFVKTPTPKVV